MIEILHVIGVQILLKDIIFIHDYVDFKTNQFYAILIWRNL